MGTYTWLGTTAPLDWSDSADWSQGGITPAGPPGASDTAIIQGTAATYDVTGAALLAGAPLPGTIDFAAPLQLAFAAGASFTDQGTMFGGSLQLATTAEAPGQVFANDATIFIAAGLLVGAGVTLAGTGEVDFSARGAAPTIAGAVGSGQDIVLGVADGGQNAVVTDSAAFQGVLQLAPGASATFTDQTQPGNYVDGQFFFAGGGEVRIGFVGGAESLAQASGSGGLTLTAEAALPCFAAGTRLAVPGGAVPVETLRAGDAVCLAGGGVADLVWVGHRRVRCDRHPRPREVWPVRIRAGSFGPARPARDLYLSPDHALLLHGVLVPVRCLIDGGAIAQVPAATVAYHHVELARHDVLLAENLPCESFLDTGQRAPRMPPPAFAQRLHDAEGCAPRVLAGPALARARRRA